MHAHLAAQIRYSNCDYRARRALTQPSYAPLPARVPARSLAGALLGERLREAVGADAPLAVEYGPSQAQRDVEGHRRRRVPIKLAALLDGVREAGVAVHTPPKRW